MSSDVRDVGESGTDLINCERVLAAGESADTLAAEGSNDRGNVDAGAGQTRLPEPYVGIHRNAREHFHTGKFSTAAAARLGRRSNVKGARI